MNNSSKIDRLGTVKDYLMPSDIKTWVAAISALAAGVVAFVKSDQWAIAALVLVGTAVSGALVVMVMGRLAAIENEAREARKDVKECRESHASCERRVARTQLAVTVLHTRYASQDPTIPRLEDLLGDDALAALLAAQRVESNTCNLRS